MRDCGSIRVKCWLCGTEMRMMENERASDGRRWQAECPKCGMRARRMRRREDAIEQARAKYDARHRYTRMPVRCEYYASHDYKAQKVVCESAFADGLRTSSTFAQMETMLIHMQKYCRGEPERCPLAKVCAEKYEKR